MIYNLCGNAPQAASRALSLSALVVVTVGNVRHGSGGNDWSPRQVYPSIFADHLTLIDRRALHGRAIGLPTYMLASLPEVDDMDRLLLVVVMPI